MLAFTNRIVEDDAGVAGFSTRHVPASPALSSAEVAAAPGGGWQLGEVQRDIGDDQAVLQLVPLLRGERPVLVHVHGCFNPPPVCFERGALLERLYGVRVVLFSWPSEGLLPDGSDRRGAAPSREDETSLALIHRDNQGQGGVAGIARRYRQAKRNAEASAAALARLLRLVAAARLFAHVQPFSVSAHSLGGHLLQHTVPESGALEALGAATNLVLIAPCAAAAGHRDWLARVRPSGQVFVTCNDADNVLYGARIADGDEVKLGADPGAERVVSDAMRYISFDHYAVGAFGHTYFALPKMPKAALKVFQRLLGSERDIRPGELPQKVYPMGCDADGLTCWMAAATRPEPG
jgi:hypothetical protein